MPGDIVTASRDGIWLFSNRETDSHSVSELGGIALVVACYEDERHAGTFSVFIVTNEGLFETWEFAAGVAYNRFKRVR